ncbi:hypothetical protein EsDP_00004714 [Epichloe bromicola]|uniref:Uncharacterized protein n=1 Tax=Epichloe bromicola TaxID=79588 RepID=A0ABQ0CSJ4_9HYPO
MENLNLLRLKCDTYRANLSLAKVTKEKLEGKLAAAKTTIADQNKNISTLTTQLSRAQKELESEKSRVAALEKQVQASEAQKTCDALRSQVDSKTYQARVYKVALKAALKLPGVASQATYSSLLEMTERQMRKTREEKLADKEEMERLARAQEGEPRRDYCLAESALPRNDTVCGLASERHGEVAAEEPQTPGTKRGAESDSDGAPMAKIRRLTPRQSPRRIIHDD